MAASYKSPGGRTIVRTSVPAGAGPEGEKFSMTGCPHPRRNLQHAVRVRLQTVTGGTPSRGRRSPTPKGRVTLINLEGAICESSPPFRHAAVDLYGACVRAGHQLSQHGARASRVPGRKTRPVTAAATAQQRARLRGSDARGRHQSRRLHRSQPQRRPAPEQRRTRRRQGCRVHEEVRRPARRHRLVTTAADSTQHRQVRHHSDL